MGYKDIIDTMSDAEYAERIGFLNDVLADDAETIRQWQDDMAADYAEAERRVS